MKTVTVKKPKTKNEKKSSTEPSKLPTSLPTQAVQVSQPQPPQIVTFLQHPQQQIKLKQEVQQPQQIIISMSQAQAAMFQQQKNNALYTFPSNLVLNSGAYITNTDMTNNQ